MKKIIKNNLLGFILGAVIFSGITVLATKYLASDISFTPKDTTWKKSNGENITNVKDAIDDLYNKSNNKSINIISLGKYNSTTASTIDLTNYDNFRNYTINNFVLCNAKKMEVQTSNCSWNYNNVISNYNSSSGTLTTAKSNSCDNGWISYFEYEICLIDASILK